MLSWQVNGSRNVECNFLPYKMDVMLNVFSRPVVYWVGGEAHRRDVVIVHHGRLGNVAVKLLK